MIANEEKSVMLDVYSTREQAGRRKPSSTNVHFAFALRWHTSLTTFPLGIEMIPCRNWGDGQGGLIGCSIRFCMFDAVNDVVWHVLVRAV